MNSTTPASSGLTDVEASTIQKDIPQIIDTGTYKPTYEILESVHVSICRIESFIKLLLQQPQIYHLREITPKFKLEQFEQALDIRLPPAVFCYFLIANGEAPVPAELVLDPSNPENGINEAEYVPGIECFDFMFDQIENPAYEVPLLQFSTTDEVELARISDQSACWIQENLLRFNYLAFGFRLLALDEILEIIHDQEKMEFDEVPLYDHTLTCASYPKDSINLHLFADLRSWLPLAVDLDPGPGGRYGQVISWKRAVIPTDFHNIGVKAVLFRSWDHFLSQLARDLYDDCRQLQEPGVDGGYGETFLYKIGKINQFCPIYYDEYWHRLRLQERELDKFIDTVIEAADRRHSAQT